MNTSNTSFSIALSNTELVTAIKLMGGGVIHALEDPFQALEDDQVEVCEDAALENLKSTGLIAPDGPGKYKMDLAFYKTLDLLINPEKVVRIRKESNPSYVFNIYTKDGIEAAWFETETGSGLTIFKDRLAVQHEAQKELCTPKSSPSLAPVDIESRELEIALHLQTVNRTQEALEVLLSQGMEKHSAELFLQGYARRTDILSIDFIFLHQADISILVKKIELITGPGFCFWIQPGESNAVPGIKRTMISSVSSDDVTSSFLELLGD